MQCDECGVCGSTVTNPCGTCKRLSKSSHLLCSLSCLPLLLVREENNMIDPNLEAGAQQRYIRIHSRMSRSPFPSPSPSQTPSSSHLGQPQGYTIGATTNLAELQALAQVQNIRHVPQPVSTSQYVRKILVHLEIRRSNNPKQTDKELGVSCLPYPETLTMLGAYSVFPCNLY